MNKLFKIYDSTIELITSTLMAFLVIILFGQVVSRYIFNFPMMWSEEIGRYLFIWIAYLGSAQVFIKGEHLSVDVLSSKLISPYNSYLKLITHIIIIIFLFFVFLYGLKYTEMHWDNPAYSLRSIKLGYVYLAVPVGAILMIFNIIRIIPDILKNNKR